MRKFATYTLAATLAAIGTPVLAQQGGQQQQQQQQRQQQRMTAQQQQSQQMRLKAQRMRTATERQFQGTIQAVRTIDIAGAPEKHVLAKVQTRRGPTVVVDLGPVSNLGKQRVQRFEQGDRIQGVGTIGRLADRPLLVAYGFQVGQGQNAQMVRVRNPQQVERRRAMMARGVQPGQRGLRAMPEPTFGPQDQSAVIQGELTDMRKVTLQGLPDAHHLVKLESQDGRTIVVDLGTAQQIQDLRLSQGDRVIVAGNPGRINGNPVLFATHVAEVHAIPREQQADRATPRR